MRSQKAIAYRMISPGHGLTADRSILHFDTAVAHELNRHVAMGALAVERLIRRMQEFYGESHTCNSACNVTMGRNEVLGQIFRNGFNASGANNDSSAPRAAARDAILAIVGSTRARVRREDSCDAMEFTLGRRRSKGPGNGIRSQGCGYAGRLSIPDGSLRRGQAWRYCP